MDLYKTKFNFILIVICCLCLFGCAGQQKEKEYIKTPVYVNTPVMQVPAIKPVPRPELEINTLTDNSTPVQIVEAYYNSLQALIKYVNILEQALKPFYTEYEKNARNQRKDTMQ